MNIVNIKKINRSQKLDIGGNLFLKGKLQFRFIKKWVGWLDADMLKLKKKQPDILRKRFELKALRRYTRIKKRYIFKRKKKRNKALRILRKFGVLDMKLYLRANQKYLQNFPNFKYKFNPEHYDLDTRFFRYYTLRKNYAFLNYRLHYDKLKKKPNLRMDESKRRGSFYKRVFLRKQRFKSFFNFKNYQLKNTIFSLKKNKFYLYDFYYNLEYRIDTILYRIFFFQNFKDVRRFIKTYGVYINSKYIKDYSFLTKIGDIIQLSKNLDSLKNILYLMKQFVLVPFPKYFEVNYNTLTIVIKSFFLFKNSLYLKNKQWWQFLLPKHIKRFPFVQRIYSQFKRSKTNINTKRYRLKYHLVDKNNYNPLPLQYHIKRTRKFNLIHKNRLRFIVLPECDQLYFPFKFELEDLNQIFKFY